MTHLAAEIAGRRCLSVQRDTPTTPRLSPSPAGVPDRFGAVSNRHAGRDHGYIARRLRPRRRRRPRRRGVPGGFRKRATTTLGSQAHGRGCTESRLG